MSLDDRCERLVAGGYGCVAGYLRKLADDPAYAVRRAAAAGHGNVVGYFLDRIDRIDRISVCGTVIEHEAVAQGQSIRR